jgi:hypothetical protein
MNGLSGICCTKRHWRNALKHALSTKCALQGTDVNLEAEKEGMLGSTQQTTTIAALPPERLLLNRRPLEDKVRTQVWRSGVPLSTLQSR